MHPLPVSVTDEAVVWAEDRVRQTPEGAGCGEGFVLEDVEDGAHETAGAEFFREGGLVDHLPAGDIDDDGSVLHELEAAGVDEALGGFRQRDGEHEHVGRGQSFVELFYGEHRVVCVVPSRRDIHARYAAAEGFESFGALRTDAAAADYRYRPSE